MRIAGLGQDDLSLCEIEMISGSGNQFIKMTSHWIFLSRLKARNNFYTISEKRTDVVLGRQGSKVSNTCYPPKNNVRPNSRHKALINWLDGPQNLHKILLSVHSVRYMRNRTFQPPVICFSTIPFTLPQYCPSSIMQRPQWLFRPIRVHE